MCLGTYLWYEKSILGCGLWAGLDCEIKGLGRLGATFEGVFFNFLWAKKKKKKFENTSRMSNIESNNSQNGGLEGYNNISDGIFPHFTTPSIKITLG